MRDPAEHIFKMRVTGTFLRQVDDWRRAQPNPPSRSKAVREIVAKANEPDFPKEWVGQMAALVADAARFRWLIENCTEVIHDTDGEETGQFLHFGATDQLETVTDAIDRHVRNGTPKKDLVT